jgi:hypothetical protein
MEPMPDLHQLADPFTAAEIDSIINNLPNGKSPGPDGFNSNFMKKCWQIISHEFYDLCTRFYENNICLQSINGSYIVLIPKKDNPMTINDYRPISLLNSSIKLLTKILANRLQSVIMRVIHQNQYEFIKSRSIQDCLAWSFKYMHMCHKSKKEMIILKLDFEKAFDTIDHEVIIQILRHKGFPGKWIEWIQGVLTSATSSVLLNGTPGKVFHYRRGVRQGDPLSPLLFVLAADLLQSVINKAKENGILKLPIDVGYSNDFPIVQYVDDTLMIMEVSSQQLFALKALLNTFVESTCLRVNYSKSCMYPINITQEKLKHLAATFNCQMGAMPFTYLGLPLSTNKPSIQDRMPLVHRCEKDC